jgi:hypothetical protein
MRDLADLAPPVVKTGGAQISDMAEGSQICDFRFAKVGPEGDFESSAACRIKIQCIEFLCDKTGGARLVPPFAKRRGRDLA